jgi:hypothetical protein
LDHVHRFIAGNRAQRPLLGPEPQTRRDSLFDETVILFQDIVSIGDRTTATAPTQLLFSLQLRDSRRICRMSIHVDHSRLDRLTVFQRALQEGLGRSRIALRREHEIDGFPCGVYRPIEKLPLSGDLDQVSSTVSEPLLRLRQSQKRRATRRVRTSEPSQGEVLLA